MSKSKSQNSIIALATLGVYLGLLLAGATPGVLAQQAALTKEFNLKDEIETSDKLDNDPDDCRTADFEKIQELRATYLWFNDRSIGEYRYLIEQLLDSYSEVPVFDVNWKPVGELRPWRSVTASTELIGAKQSSDDIGAEIIILGNGLPGKSFSFSATKDDYGHSFKLESTNFPYDQPLVRYLYSAAFDFYRCPPRGSELEDIILRHSEIKVENRNLIITTRLPRGSLRTLLATDAK